MLAGINGAAVTEIPSPDRRITRGEVRELNDQGNGTKARNRGEISLERRLVTVMYRGLITVSISEGSVRLTGA